MERATKKLILTIILLLPGLSLADDDRAIASVTAWLQLVDSGAYVQSWEQSAPLFQQQISSEDWQAALKSVRQPLGSVISRDVESRSEHNALPGAPDGEYVVVTMASSFEHKARATETITFAKVGGEWRAVGYFIK